MVLNQKLKWWQEIPLTLGIMLSILTILFFMAFLFQSFYTGIAYGEESKIYISEENAVYRFSLDEVILLTQLLDGDYRISGDGEFSISRRTPNYHEIYKVLSVVLNRVNSPKFPNTVTEVILQKGQFEVIPKVLKTIPHWRAFLIVYEWCYKYDPKDPSIQVVPTDHLFFYGDGRINHTRRGY